MSAPGMTSPIRKETFENLQLNAGIILMNFPVDSYDTPAALKAAIASAVSSGTYVVGATRGGGSFTVTRELRQPEIDGMRYNFVGSNFVDSADANLTTTLLEVTPANIQMLLATGSATTSGSKTTIKMRTAIDTQDYLSNIVWVGDISDGGLVAIVLKNALNTADFSLTYTDKGEGTLAAEFHAHQADVLDYDYAPFEIIYFDVINDPWIKLTQKSAEITTSDALQVNYDYDKGGYGSATTSITATSDNTSIATVANSGSGIHRITVTPGSTNGTVTITVTMTLTQGGSTVATVTDTMTVRNTKNS